MKTNYTIYLCAALFIAGAVLADLEYVSYGAPMMAMAAIVYAAYEGLTKITDIIFSSTFFNKQFIDDIDDYGNGDDESEFTE